MWVEEPGAPAPQPPTFYLWPENEQPWQLFMACSTRWRQGMGGPTGLDDVAVEMLMQRRHIHRRRRARMWQLLDAMQAGALQGWRERQNDPTLKAH